MTPAQASALLRNIAEKIDNSTLPSISLVAATLQNVVVALEGDSFSSPPGGALDDRQQKEIERRKQKESENILKKTQEDLGKNVERLVEDGFKNLEKQIGS
jgi:hypothetical protein